MLVAGVGESDDGIGETLIRDRERFDGVVAADEHLVECVTAKLDRAFEDRALELIHAHLAVEPVAPGKLRPQLPERLGEIITRLLAKAPEQRYQTAEGLRVDLERVSERMPEYVHDFPGGAGRFVQKAKGYRATICNGEVTYERGEHTGALPGRLVRGAPAG